MSGKSGVKVMEIFDGIIDEELDRLKSLKGWLSNKQKNKRKNKNVGRKAQLHS